MENKNETAKVKHKVYSSGSSVSTLSSEILAKELTICEEWKLSIDLKLPNRSTTEWRNIFSLYNEPNTLDKRILAVSIRPGQSNLMMKIANDMFTSQTYDYKVTKKVNAGNWISLKISQMKGVYEIEVDYKIVYSITNVAPKTWTKVYLITGNTNFNEKVLTTIHYRNFKINTCRTKSKKL